MEKLYTKAKIQYIDIERVKKKKDRNVRVQNVKKKLSFDYKKASLYVLPVSFFGFGAILISSQVLPSAKFIAEQQFSTKYAEIISPIPTSEYGEMTEFNIEGKFESQYFSNLFQELHREDSEKIAGVSLPYKFDWEGQFNLTIPSIGINQMSVTANVNSYEEKVYNEVLKNSLAHFKGTDLPTPLDYESESSNTFIYGHSAPSSWAAFHKNSFEAAFNPLFELNIGDEIIVTFEEKDYVYSVRKIKVTKPEDISTLQGVPGKQVLTLMTCAPPGSTSNRLNIIATLKTVQEKQ